jgi:hypothetical protein
MILLHEGLGFYEYFFLLDHKDTTMNMQKLATIYYFWNLIFCPHRTLFQFLCPIAQQAGLRQPCRVACLLVWVYARVSLVMINCSSHFSTD